MSSIFDVEPPAQDGPVADVHSGLHSEDGGLRTEHLGRSKNPVIKVEDLAWLEFVKPNLDRAEIFARDFGFAVADRTADALYLRGTWSRVPCLVIRKGESGRFAGPTFLAADRMDLDRLGSALGAPVERYLDGWAVEVADPSGIAVRVVYGLEALPALPDQPPLPWNIGADLARVDVGQRPVKQPARVQRLGHVVLETPKFRRALDWYLDSLGMIVSDFLYLDDLRDRGPTMAFIRSLVSANSTRMS